MGGLWEAPAASVRTLCEIYRALASGDPSVALVSSMHPRSSRSGWPAPTRHSRRGRSSDEPSSRAPWRGEQWGTITSEPGSGGDIGRTRAVATPIDATRSLPGAPYAVTGDKHFGSGSGITDRMMTTALPEGEDEPDDLRARRPRPAVGRHRRAQLIAEWDGMGMAATQSHAMRLEGAAGRAPRLGRRLEPITRAAGP